MEKLPVSAIAHKVEEPSAMQKEPSAMQKEPAATEYEPSATEYEPSAISYQSPAISLKQQLITAVANGNELVATELRLLLKGNASAGTRGNQ